MIYKIKNNYYIRIAPNVYVEVSFNKINNIVDIVPSTNKIEYYGNDVEQIDFNKNADELYNITHKSFTIEKEETKNNSFRTLKGNRSSRL